MFKKKPLSQAIHNQIYDTYFKPAVAKKWFKDRKLFIDAIKKHNEANNEKTKNK